MQAAYRSLKENPSDPSLAIAFAFVEQLLNSPEKDLAVAQALSVLDATIPMLKKVGFEAFAYEDFYDTLVSLVRDVVPGVSKGPALTSAALLEKFQAAEGIVFIRVYHVSPPYVLQPLQESNYIVGYLRMVTVGLLDACSAPSY
jgi:hypothetical protein